MKYLLLLQNLGVNHVGTEVRPVICDAQVESGPASRKMGTICSVNCLSCIFKVCNKFPGTQTPAVATTDCAVQCSLSAPPLSFFGNSPEQPSIDDSRESDVIL